MFAAISVLKGVAGDTLGVSGRVFIDGRTSAAEGPWARRRIASFSCGVPDLPPLDPAETSITSFQDLGVPQGVDLLGRLAAHEPAQAHAEAVGDCAPHGRANPSSHALNLLPQLAGARCALQAAFPRTTPSHAASRGLLCIAKGSMVRFSLTWAFTPVLATLDQHL